MSTRQDSFCSNAAEEFCRTEKTYLASLEVLIECYLKPVMTHPKIADDPTTKNQLEDFVALVMRIMFCHKVLDSKIKGELEEQQAAVLKDLQRLSLAPGSPNKGELVAAQQDNVAAATRDVSGSSTRSESTISSGDFTQRSNSMLGSYGSLILSSSSTADVKAFGRMLTDFPKLLLEMSSSFKDPYSEYIMQHEGHVGLMEETVQRLGRIHAEMTSSTSSSAPPRPGDEQSEGEWVMDMSMGVTFEQHTQTLVEAHRANHVALAENIGCDLSLAALLNAPLKRLTNYNLLTQEWISGMEKKEHEVPATALKAQRTIADILKSVERCIMLVRAAERLKVLEEKYKVPGLASQESEIIMEAHMIRGTRTTRGGNDWRTRPCYLLVCDRSMYVIKLDQYGEKGEVREGQTTVIPLHRMEQMLLKPKAKDVTQFFGDNVGMHIKFRNPPPPSARGSIVTRSSVESGKTNETDSSKEEGRARGSTLGAQDSVDLAAMDNQTKEMFLLNEDKLLVQGWDQKVKFAVNAAITNWMAQKCTFCTAEDGSD